MVGFRVPGWADFAAMLGCSPCRGATVIKGETSQMVPGLVNDHIAMENPPFLIGDTSSNGGFPFAMLVCSSVCL